MVAFISIGNCTTAATFTSNKENVRGEMTTIVGMKEITAFDMHASQ